LRLCQSALSSFCKTSKPSAVISAVEGLAGGLYLLTAVARLPDRV